MKLEVSKKQYPVYIVVKKRYLPNDGDSIPSELDLPEYHYIPDDKQIPIIGEDGTYKDKDGGPCSTKDGPELAEKLMFTNREGAENLKNRLSWSYRFEVREMLLNERIKLPEGSSDKLYSAPMICLNTTTDELIPMCINNYTYILEKLGMPYWADVEQFTKGRVVIMPLEVFMRDYAIVPRHELHLESDASHIKCSEPSETTL